GKASILTLRNSHQENRAASVPGVISGQESIWRNGKSQFLRYHLHLRLTRNGLPQNCSAALENWSGTDDFFLFDLENRVVKLSPVRSPTFAGDCISLP